MSRRASNRRNTAFGGWCGERKQHRDHASHVRVCAHTHDRPIGWSIDPSALSLCVFMCVVVCVVAWRHVGRRKCETTPSVGCVREHRQKCFRLLVVVWLGISCGRRRRRRRRRVPQQQHGQRQPTTTIPPPTPPPLQQRPPHRPVPMTATTAAAKAVVASPGTTPTNMLLLFTTTRMAMASNRCAAAERGMLCPLRPRA